MFEIAGGIVLGFFALAIVLALFVAVVSLVSRFHETILLVIGLLVIVGLVHLAAWPAYSLWEWFSTAWPTTADLLVEPLCVFAVLVFPFVMFFDSLTNFKGTRAVFRWIVKIGKPSTWKKWVRRRKTAVTP
jgi:hypothetical protein